MIKLILFFLLGSYPIYSLQAQMDLAKIISGTYKCSAHIGTFGKDDIEKDKATVRIKKTGENKVSVSLDGTTSTYELTVMPTGPLGIVGNAIIKGMNASLNLELDHKPAAIRGGSGNQAATQENQEVWWFEGTANEEKPESLPPTCSEIWSQLNAESFDTGDGDFGLVDSTTSNTIAWDNLKNARDVKYDGTKITEENGNVYFKYSPSSSATFAGKGYTIVGGITISRGPDAVKKIRFTK